MTAYSPWKFVHHRQMIDDLREGKLISPIQCQMDLFGGCNQSCKYCFYRMPWKDKAINRLFDQSKWLKLDVIRDFIDQFIEIGGKAIEITGGGESALHPDIVNVFDYIRDKGLELAFVTNGTILKQETIDSFAFASWVRISLDAAREETYNKSHGVKKGYDSALHNIKRTKETCRDTIVGISFVINPINWQEILEAASLAKDIGVDNIRFSLAYTDQFEDLHEPYWSEAYDLLIEAKRLESERFKVFALSQRMEDLALKTRNYKNCYYQQTIVVVGNDGGIWPCCTLKYSSRGLLGNLHKNSLREIWFGDKRKKWLESGTTVCKDVPCWMSDKNLFMEYVVSKDPLHVSFL